jgi:hypothetical protein
VTTWNEVGEENEAGSKHFGTSKYLQRILRLGCYLFAPQNFVLLCIANRFRAWQRTFLVGENGPF